MEIAMQERVKLIDKGENISIRKQASLLKICRAKLYYKSIIDDDSEFANMIKEIYLESDCRYGYRKINAELASKDMICNHKKVLRLMQESGLQGLYPKRRHNYSIKNKDNKVFPYLLKNLAIIRTDQVWSTDITYIKICGKFMYFIAIIDLYSRYIVSYGLSHSLDADFYVFVLQNALKLGKPEIFNTDQGSQFTSHNFVQELLQNKIQISMDHQGRCFDNIFIERLWRTLKQEAIYYYKPETIRDLEIVIDNFVVWYNYKRRHQSLKYNIPCDVYHKFLYVG